MRRCPREPSCDGGHGGDAEHNTTEGAHVRDCAVWGWHRWGCSALWVSGGGPGASLEVELRVVSQVIHSGCVWLNVCLHSPGIWLMATRMDLDMALAVKLHALLRNRVTRHVHAECTVENCDVCCHRERGPSGRHCSSSVHTEGNIFHSFLLILMFWITFT